MDSAFDNLPIIPHEYVADVDCCGCLMVRVREGQADILCGECGAVVRTVAVADVETVMLQMAQTDTICSARCTHCGALNTFPGMSAIAGLHVPISQDSYILNSTEMKIRNQDYRRNR